MNAVTMPCARCHRTITEAQWFSETCPLQPRGHTLGNIPIFDWPMLVVSVPVPTN